MSIPSSKFTLQPYVEHTAIRDSADSGRAQNIRLPRSPILHRQVATLHRVGADPRFGAGVTATDLILLVLSIAMFGYLGVALFKAEIDR
jgi:hypothetical protein